MLCLNAFCNCKHSWTRHHDISDVSDSLIFFLYLYQYYKSVIVSVSYFTERQSNTDSINKDQFKKIIFQCPLLTSRWGETYIKQISIRGFKYWTLVWERGVIFGRLFEERVSIRWTINKIASWRQLTTLPSKKNWICNWSYSEKTMLISKPFNIQISERPVDINRLEPTRRISKRLTWPNICIFLWKRQDFIMKLSFLLILVFFVLNITS